MDGASVGGLPPIAGAQPAMFPAPQRPPLAAPAVNPVGRPLGDPEAQEAKVARTAERRRLESALPKQATDSKVLVFRLKGSRPAPGARPVLTILVSELEAAKNEGTESDDFIAGKLSEKFTDGRFQCQVTDRMGRRVPDVQPWELALGEDAEDDDDLDDDDVVDEVDDQQPQYPGAGGLRGAAFAGNMPIFPGAPQPPAPQPLDLAAVAGSFRAERNDEARRSTEVMSIMTTMMQQNQQQQMMAQQQQQARDEQARRDAQEREERYRREDREREERAEKRRSEFRQTLLAAAPLLLPLVEKLFGLNKPAPGIDPTTSLLLEMVKQKAPDADIFKQMSGLMAEMTAQQMKLQGAGAQAAVTMQAEASNMVFKNIMSTMKEMMENKPVAEKEESTMEQIAKIAGAIIPAMQQSQQANPAQFQNPPQVQQQQQPANVPAVVNAEVEAAPVRKRQPPRAPAQRPAAPAAATAEPQPQYTDAQRISGSISAIRRLSITGETSVPAANRWAVLEWVAGMLPKDVLYIIAKQEKEDVIVRCQSAVIGVPELLTWLTDPENIQFLEDAINDLKAMLLDQVTPEHRASAIAANETFVRRRAEAAAASVASTAAATTAAVANQAPPAPIAGPGSKPPRTRGKRLPPSTPAAEGSPATSPTEPPKTEG